MTKKHLDAESADVFELIPDTYTYTHGFTKSVYAHKYTVEQPAGSAACTIVVRSTKSGYEPDISLLRDSKKNSEVEGIFGKDGSAEFTLSALEAPRALFQVRDQHQMLATYTVEVTSQRSAKAKEHWSPVANWSGTAPDGHEAPPFSGDMATHDGKMLYVAAPWGDLHRSLNGGESWELVEQEELNGKVTALAMTPGGETLLASTLDLILHRPWGRTSSSPSPVPTTSGVWGAFYTTDRGDHWSPTHPETSDGFAMSGKGQSLAVTAEGGIHLGIESVGSPFKDHYLETWYSQKGSGQSGWKTWDWAGAPRSGESVSSRGQRILALAGSGDAWFGATTAEPGVLRRLYSSADDWRYDRFGEALGQVTALAAAPDGQTLVAATSDNSLHRSTDRGESWKVIDEGLAQLVREGETVRMLSIAEDGALRFVGVMGSETAAFYRWATAQDELDAALIALSALQARYDALQTKYDDDLAAARAEIERIQDKSQVDLRAAGDELDRVKTRASTELAAAQTRYETLKTRYDTEILAAKERHEALQTRYDADLSAAKSRLEALQTKYDTEIPAAKERYDALQTRYNTDIAAAKERYDALQTRYNTDIAAANERYGALQTKYDHDLRAAADELGRVKSAAAAAAAAAAATAAAVLQQVKDQAKADREAAARLLQTTKDDDAKNKKDALDAAEAIRQQQERDLNAKIAAANAEKAKMENRWTLIRDMDLRLLLPLESGEQEVDRSGYDLGLTYEDHVPGADDPTALHGAVIVTTDPITGEGLDRGLTLEAHIEVTADIGAIDLFTIEVFGAGGTAPATLSVGIADLGKGQVFIRSGDLTIDYVSREGFYTVGRLAPWVLAISRDPDGRQSGSGTALWRPALHTPAGSFEGTKRQSKWHSIGPIDHDLPLPSPVTALRLRFLQPGRSDAAFALRDVRLYTRVLSDRRAETYIARAGGKP